MCFCCMYCVSKVAQERVAFLAQPFHDVGVAEVLPVQEVCCCDPDGVC